MNVPILRSRPFAAALALAALVPASAAQTALAAKRMLDVRSGELVEDVVVYVDGEIIQRIERLRPVGSFRVPEPYTLVDLGDVTLLPGLIDCHTHLTGELEGEWEYRAVIEGSAGRALRGAKNARTTLRAGFTTVRDVGSGGFADVALARAIESGFVEGPRMFAAAHSIGITGGHCDATGYRPGVLEGGPEQGIADGVDEVVKAVRYQIKHGATVIKTCATAGVLSHEESVGAQQYSQEELDALVAEASRHGIKVAAHAHGTEGIIAAVKAGVASIEHGSMLDDEAIRLMKERGTFLVPTTFLADAIALDQLPHGIREKAEYILPLARESVRRAVAEGVRIAFGTDAAVYPHGLNAKEFAALLRRGMTPIQAIRSATLDACELLGVDDRGEVAAGKLADLIAVPGNPLDDIAVLEDVRFVMKGGAVVHGGATRAYSPVMIPETHLGKWAGPNRLWVTDPEKPFRSDGTLEAEAELVRYTWSFKGAEQTGVLKLSGQPAALRADWTDTWHAGEGLVLNGYVSGGVVRLFTTYPAGEGPDWGWQIELDVRDPEAFVMRMFNVMPGVGPVPAVVLQGERAKSSDGTR